VATVLEVLRKSAEFLARKGVESPRLDAEVLLAHGLGLRRIDLYLQHDRPLTDAEQDRLRPLIVERGRGVPVAYVTGEREFFSLPLRVTPDVLVPRPETERLVEVAVEALAPRPAPRFADVGTGSGCVAVAVLHAVPAATALATDVSAAALAVAAENARRHGVADRLALLEGSWLDPLRGSDAWGRLDAVLSNPPYVVRGDPTLAADVAAHEPPGALYVPGDDALEPARAIATAGVGALAPGGLLAIEVGAGTHEAAEAMLRSLGFADVTTSPDAAGVPRVVRGRKPA
jgi:release factor glutamine methyltransferase